MRLYDANGRLIGTASPLTTKGDIYTFSTQDARKGVGADGQVLTADSSDPTGLGWTTPGGGGLIITRGATWVISSGAIATPVNDVYIRCRQAGTISKITLLTAGGPGSCVVDIWKNVYANFPPTSADSICAAAKPTISSGIKYEDSTLTGWTTTVNAGDVIALHLESTSVFSLIVAQLDIS